MFKELWQKRTKLIEENLERELQRTKFLDETLKHSMKYSLMAGGKRLRPILLMAAADTIGVSGENFITVASAIEMIHTYSLIHDDLPVMDNDDYRRGKLTNHKVFGEATAILAGDALLTLGFEVILRQRDVDSGILLSVLNEIAIAAGTAGMVGGQMIDLQSEDKKIDLSTLRKMHFGKTASLFRAAIRSGALLARADEDSLMAITQYAENFGMAFQITDDILDVTGELKTLGKPVRSDEKNFKSTYVSLTSLEDAKNFARESVDAALDALKKFDERADFLRWLVKFLIDRKN